MRQSVIKFPNLRAEMSRKNLGIGDLAEMIGANRDTLARRLSMKTTMPLNMAFQIQMSAFPDCDIRYLFARASEDGKEG